MTNRADRLRKARIAAGFVSASDAARRLGVSISTYSAHENGGRAYSVEDAAKYAARFGVTLDWLLTGRDSGGGESISIAASPLRGTPVIGVISLTGWEEREAIDLEQDFPQAIELAMLTGGATSAFFAATLAVDLPGIQAVAGDHLIALKTSTYEAGDLVIVERSGFDGRLRQLRVMRCQIEQGRLQLRDALDRDSRVSQGEETRVLGRVEALHRSYR